MSVLHERWPLILLLLVGLVTFGAKASILDVGAPYVTIDDDTMYEAGFLVWFGQAPPQRMYIESWVSGISSIGTYVARSMASEEGLDVGVNLVADAYRDFYVNPDPYVLTYRVVSFLVDLLTVVFVFLLARLVFTGRPAASWAPYLVTVLYMLTYNTVWSSIVARPDTPTTLLVVIGTWFYLRSRHGERLDLLLFAALFIGLGAGYKLHGAFAAIFGVLDILRVRGLREGWRSMLALGAVSFLFFAVGSGMILFDPLLYAKLRMLNHEHDVSPWIRWGDQFVTVLRGTGWLAIPFAVVGTLGVLREGWRSRSPLTSVAFMAIGWLLLFASIRQLRAYWMLPALPLFYVVAVQGLAMIRRPVLRFAPAAVLVLVLAWQFTGQVREFATVPYGEIRDWVRANLRPDQSMYILGYEAIALPKSERAREVERIDDERRIRADRAAGMTFTESHVVHWEERASAVLDDMVGPGSVPGFDYHGMHALPPERFDDLFDFSDVDVVLTHERGDVSSAGGLVELVESTFEPVATGIGPGGGGSGMRYTVHVRKGNESVLR